MTRRKIRCPECDVRLVLPAGADEIECPRCEHIFSAPTEEEEKGRNESPARSLLLVGGGTVLAAVAVVGVLTLTGVFSRKTEQAAPQSKAPIVLPAPAPGERPVRPAPVLGATGERPARPALSIAPAAEDPDPFRPREPGATLIVAELDRLAQEGPEIPQDAERAKRTRRARLEWSRNMIDRAFDNFGRTDAPWAAKARAALALRAEELAAGHPFTLSVNKHETSLAALDEAVADGCDDPLVLYYHNVMHNQAGHVPPDRVLDGWRRVARLVWESRYPDVRKVYAAHNLLSYLQDRNAPADEIATWDQRYWELLARVCTDPDPETQEHVLNMAGLREELVRVREGREKGYEAFAACLKKAGAPEYTRLAARGAFLIRFAWDARGSGLASTVTDDGWRLFAQRLADAEDALVAAYELAPDRPHAPTSMLTVCMGRGHPRDEMEEWFERALRAEPDNMQACHKKLEYLHPKWHGSPEEHIGFAWQCVRTRNTVGLLPYAAVANLTSNAPIPERMTPASLAALQPVYTHPTTWRVLDTALNVLHRDRPELRWLRGTHAKIAGVAGRFSVAVRELNAAGDDYRTGGFRSAAELNIYREWLRTGQLPPG